MAAQIHLHDNSYVNATYVPNVFFDTYMAAAPGEYVKVYLYLLRCLSGSKPFTIGMIADIFEYTEGDIRRALSYWEKVNLLSLEYDQSGDIKGIYFHYGSETSTNTSSTTNAKTEQITPSEVSNANSTSDHFVPAKGTYTASQLADFSKDEDIEQLIFLAESYMKRSLTSEDISALYYWNRDLGLSADLIEYLIETCLSLKLTSIKDMEKTAILWYNNNVTTRKEAKSLSITSSPFKSVIMKAFGIKGRDLSPWECEFIRRWTSDWSFTEPILNEACRRTIAKTHQPSFEYTDSILKSWHDAKASSMAEIIALDDAYKAKKAENAKATAKKQAVAKKQTTAKFNNFTARKYDFSELEQQLVMN